MKNERNVQGFNDGSSSTEMICVTMSRSFRRTTLESFPVVDSTSVLETGRSFSEMSESSRFSLEGGGPDTGDSIEAVSRTRRTREEGMFL